MMILIIMGIVVRMRAEVAKVGTLFLEKFHWFFLFFFFFFNLTSITITHVNKSLSIHFLSTNLCNSMFRVETGIMFGYLNPMFIVATGIMSVYSNVSYIAWNWGSCTESYGV